jgi:hypothetical protein
LGLTVSREEPSATKPSPWTEVRGHSRNIVLGKIEGAVALHHNVCQAPFGIVEEKKRCRRRVLPAIREECRVIGIGAIANST